MNRDDIMALANQTAGQHWMDEAHIQRFAALLIAAEREACAKVADKYAAASRRIWPDGSAAFSRCAEAIRARGEA